MQVRFQQTDTYPYILKKKIKRLFVATLASKLRKRNLKIKLFQSAL